MDEEALFAAALDKNFAAALDKDGLAERDAFLDEACDGNADLRAKVQKLLEAHSAAGSFLKSPTAAYPGGEEPGAQIGRYKLLQIIGEGGMGVVYMAEQTQPVKRRVALKVIKPGMDSKQVIARFEAERQALAMMDHPNIAKVLDAGTTQGGRPYFVMELVKGVPVTKFCDQQRLTPEERLEMFIPICQAVQHAHQKGIIHRDIKPSNILIAQYDDQAVPKIIDFGLAKALSQQLTEKTLFTQYGEVVGSIDYMSPEQSKFNQLDIDTRTDVYSLGVVLYELLSGTTPFDRKRLRAAAINEVLRIIQQEEPPRPSIRLSSSENLAEIAANRQTEAKRLSLLVRGDLDWIVMKAMDKERNRRYETSNGFAEDIRRHLEDEVVQACPPSTTYRLRKLARRHRALLASVGAVVAALVLGLAGTSWGLIQTKKANEQLATQYRQLEERSRTLQGNIQIQLRLARGRVQFEESTAELLDRMTKRIQRSPDLQLLKPDMEEVVIQFWDRRIDIETSRRTIFYRIQRALALARRGSHKEAFDGTQALQYDGSVVNKWLGDLCRICAVCAAAASNDPALSELYRDQGIEYFRQAADDPITKPPKETDPDLRPLKSHPDFEKILQLWGENWRYLADLPAGR